MLISNLLTARKPTELARATNKSSRANIFARFVNKSSWAGSLPWRARASRAEVTRRPALVVALPSGS
jgi:hypothetical protein